MCQAQIVNYYQHKDTRTRHHLLAAIDLKIAFLTSNYEKCLKLIQKYEMQCPQPNHTSIDYNVYYPIIDTIKTQLLNKQLVQNLFTQQSIHLFNNFNMFSIVIPSNQSYKFRYN